MNKCDECGFMHYRTDPCRVAKKSTAARKDVLRQADPLSYKAAIGKIGHRPPQEREAGTQALPVDTTIPKPKRGRPRLHADRKAYKAAWERKRRSDIKSGIRTPKPRGTK